MTTASRTTSDTDSLVSVLGDFILVVVGLALLVAGTLLRGYVLWRYWGWFAVPAGAPVIGWRAMVGVLLVGTLALEGLGNMLVQIRDEVVPSYRDANSAERIVLQFLSGVVRCGFWLALGLLFRHVVLS